MTMPKNKKILEEIHPLNIIKEVQKWPVLYEKDNLERTNFHFKTKVWKEVAKTLIPDWEELSEIQKEVKVSDLSKKWRNLRDTFRRHVESERRAQRIGGGTDSPRRPYVYFKHMSFLLPHVASPSDTGDITDVLATETQYTPRPAEPTRLKKRKRKVRSSSAGIEFRSADVFIEEGITEGGGGVKLELLPEGHGEPSYSETDDDEDLST
ncbi:transcription factor Adf-1 isoform X3 [Pieris rapae]|uniref:transcription factor Adf-1 isoform X3 n=1 Tax=Pieris rapae TaxID=64459 RepID=UPI001E27E486|nr:transcription factor Adf-1 isoform X3 [Pieris rapae]